MKAPYIGYSQPPEAIEVMKKLKQVFDPKGIMVGHAWLASPAERVWLTCPRRIQNPYKYFLV